MTKSLTEMTVDIAVAQAGHAPMTGDEIEALLNKTFKTLQQIKAIEEQGAVAEAAVSPEPIVAKKSIQRNKVICLECGKEFKQLTRAHLKSHALTAKEYRRKYGFSGRQALSAKSLSTQRRKKAKELGFGERLKKARKAKKKKA